MHEILEATRGKKRVLVEVHLAQRFGFAKKATQPTYPLVHDEEMIALINWARDHFSNAIPQRDVSAVTKRVFRELESRVEKEERAALAPPPAKAKPTAKSIPRSNRRHGGHEVENLRLACRAHNSWFAELRYGKEYIQKRTRLRQRKSPARSETRRDVARRAPRPPRDGVPSTPLADLGLQVALAP